MLLETKRLYLREFNEDDFDDLAALLQDPQVMYAYEHDFSKQDVKDWLDRQIQRYRRDGFGLWAVILKANHKFIGQVGLSMQDYRGTQILELGYLLKKEYWHQGYAYEACCCCQNYAFYHLKQEHLHAIIKHDNYASIALAKKLGMQKEDEFLTTYYHGEMLHYLYTSDKNSPICLKMRDEQLQESHVQKIQEYNQKIILHEYDPKWVNDYQYEEKKIKEILKDKVIQIEHVGSTSVPGLCAKRIIDILLIVADSSKEEDYVPQLLENGYILKVREPDWYGHRMFLATDRAIHLHVFSKDCLEAKRMLVFRDWLINHPEDRELYAQTKRSLAQKVWRYVQDYADQKSAVVQAIMTRALKNNNEKK